MVLCCVVGGLEVWESSEGGHWSELYVSSSYCASLGENRLSCNMLRLIVIFVQVTCKSGSGTRTTVERDGCLTWQIPMGSSSGWIESHVGSRYGRAWTQCEARLGRRDPGDASPWCVLEAEGIPQKGSLRHRTRKIIHTGSSRGLRPVLFSKVSTPRSGC